MLAVLGGLALAWLLADVLLLTFGAVVLAVVLRAGGNALARFTPLSPRAGVLVIVLLVLALLGALAAAMGGQLAAQATQLEQALPEAVARGSDWLARSDAGSAIAERLRAALEEGMGVGMAWRTASSTVGAVATLLLVVLVTLYLAVDPCSYRRGLLHLLPERRRALAAADLDAAGAALRRWMLGQGLSMLCVGVLVGTGLWLLDMPMALVLALLAGLLEFVPVVGPIIAAVPAVLVGFIQGPQTALYVALLYLAVQQVEGYLILPLAQRWAVHLPPALGLLSVVALGSLFGLPGVLFATPLTVVAMAWTRRALARRDGADAGP